jgi:DHA1 family bicyclomycin/chloramphenicol resistance-like MFS transporter
MPTVPIVELMVGAGMASSFALTGAVSVNQHAIGAASGLYGFTQMPTRCALSSSRCGGQARCAS